MDEQQRLVIETAGVQHAAHYFCVYRQLIESVHYLEVVKRESKKLVGIYSENLTPQFHSNLYEQMYTDFITRTTTGYIDIVIQVTLSGHNPRPADNTTMRENNLFLFTSWGEWTKCSDCGKVGFRRRTGTCVVKVRPYKNITSKLIFMRQKDTVL